MTDTLSQEGQPRDHHAEVLAAALGYLDRGFSIVPQRAGDKKPCVRWKPFQERLPTREEVADWLTRQFPDAGLAVVLGPVSNLFVIDVDGPEAHAELVKRLGSEPVAPKVLSGSGKPSRYHLFFRHPAVPTRARITPWHPKLEFRGDKGIVVLPPSVHRSGMRYRWAPGQSLDDVALPDVPAAVLHTLGERAKRDAGQVPQADKRAPTPAELSRVQERARSYLAKLPPAVEGQGGDKQTFTAACHLVLGFGLSPADALPLLREYNERCRPPWVEADLVRKLHEADRRPGPRGTLLRLSAQPDLGEGDEGGASADGPVQPAGEPFVGVVPDFAQADWLKAKPRAEARDDDGRRRQGRARIGGGFHWAVHLAVIDQRSARVVLPDILLAQVFWGGDRSDWPSNWRRHLLHVLKQFTGGPQSPFVEVGIPERAGETTCPDACVLHGSPVRHRHTSILIATEHDVEDADRLDDEGQPAEDAWLARVFLGVLEMYGFDTAQGDRVYDFTLRSQQANLEAEASKALTGRLRGFTAKGRLASVYVPLRLFGGSPRLGLTFSQRQPLLAVHRELTRDRKSDRPDKAEVLIAGKVAYRVGPYAIDQYPGLAHGRRYVGFNGNGGGKRRRFSGRGYRLLGDKGWLVRAGYAPLGEAGDAWPQVRSFLKDLGQVAGPFGLAVAGRRRRTGEWLGLADLLDRTGTAAGRRWLGECILRVYTEEDYLARWRRVIAQRMGFSVIPDRDQEQSAVTTPYASPVQLITYLRIAGISRTDLARELGVSKSLLSQYLNGRKAWTARWQDRLKAWVERREADGRW